MRSIGHATQMALLMVLTATVTAPAAEAPGAVAVTINIAHPGEKIPPLFYGLMTEEINHAYDGGLYGELIQNRIFADDADKPVHWSPYQTGKARTSIALDRDRPVNGDALKASLRIDITTTDSKDGGGVSNDGYWGIPVLPHTKYHACFYARASEGFTGPLLVAIEGNDGKETFAIATVAGVGTQWKKYDVDLETKDAAVSSDNRFAIATQSAGTLWLSLVSLFPPTYHDRPNGNRIDLMQKLADLHPTFLRFPGGNYLEGDTLEQRFDWKKTIGPLEQRPGHAQPWGYRSSDGLGLLEFFEWCEDLKIEPILAVYAGYSMQQHHIDAGAGLAPYVQDALDEIEYATGDASTMWGKQRIDGGHAAPFPLKFVEIGNEDEFDKSGSYDGRFTQFHDAIKAKYPAIACIATTRVHTRTPDFVDDHAYPSHAQMEGMVHRYDAYDAKLPRIFFGEWATIEGSPTPTWRAAVADAAWMTGMQNSCAAVRMQCYAPLLVNVNRGARQWPTNLIGYDAVRSFGSTSYQVQALFSGNWGDVTLPSHVTGSAAPADLPAGSIALGLWNTAGEYKDIRVLERDQTRYQSNFAQDMAGWEPQISPEGWAVKDGALQHVAAHPEARIALREGHDWRNYTLTLKARKLSGDEGFLIAFHVADRDNFTWLNLGGWNNARSGIEQSINGRKELIGRADGFRVDPNRWFDVRIEIADGHIKGFVDGKQIIEAKEKMAEAPGNIFAAASRDEASGEIIVKLVNSHTSEQTVAIELEGASAVDTNGTMQTLAGTPNDVNTLQEPTRVAPKVSKLDHIGAKFSIPLPPLSVNVVRVKAR